MKRQRASSVFSGEPMGLKSESCVEMLNSMAGFRAFLALSRKGEIDQSALRIVKSFAVLSVRERSSGNSEAKTAHNSRLTKAIPNVLTIIVRLGILR
jgi:hypothetical protein